MCGAKTKQNKTKQTNPTIVPYKIKIKNKLQKKKKKKKTTHTHTHTSPCVSPNLPFPVDEEE